MHGRCQQQMFPLNAHQGPHLPQDTWDLGECGLTLPTVLREQANQEDRIPWRHRGASRRSVSLWVSIAQLLPTLPPAALTGVIMSLEQKSQHYKPDEDLEAQGEARAWWMRRLPLLRSRRLPPSSALVPVTLGRCLLRGHRVISRALGEPPPSPLPMRVPAAATKERRGQAPLLTQSLVPTKLSVRRWKTWFVFCSSSIERRSRSQRREMLEKVIKKYKHYFAVIFRQSLRVSKDDLRH
ncbi:Melanoma-associated antigen 11 [Plecturocebus cupreus]